MCIDIDGTLVGSGGVVHGRIWEAADALRERGVRIAICSGRPCLGIARDYAQRLDDRGWHSFQNGASIFDLGTGEMLSAYLPPHVVAQIVARARETGRMLELYSDVAYAIEHTTPRAVAHAALLGVPFAPRPFESLVGGIVRAQWMVPFDETASVLAEHYEGLEASPSTSPVMPDTQFISYTCSGINKGFAVRTIAEQYGVALGEVMFVGDSANDLPAMSLVGVPVAMENAEEHVLRIATHVVGHVDAGALADALHLALDLAR